MNGETLLFYATSFAFAVLILAMFLTVIRLIKGPSLADRILALDVLTTVGIGMIATFAIRTGFTLYLDIAIALGLLGFLSTVAFSRYLLMRAEVGDKAAEEGGET